MAGLLEHLATLTGHRERSQLDLTLARALMDLLSPVSVAVFGTVGEADAQRWLQLVRLDESGGIAVAAPLWVELETLPRLEDAALRTQCLHTRQVVRQRPGPGAPGHTTLFPLFSEARVEGIVEIASAAPLSAATQRVISSMQRIYCNMYSLLDYSERDTLTGLFNRKSFDEVFYKAVTAQDAAPGLQAMAPGVEQRRDALEESYWLGMVDIDHFKQVNDRFGHLIGDEVLLLVARILRNSFRFHDRLYRFGGEEFVVLLRGNGEQAAGQAFERFRNNMAAFNFPQMGRITASIGFTGVLPGDSPSSAIERADKSVYHAKNRGRNRVFCHEELVRSGSLAEVHKEGAVELF